MLEMSIAGARFGAWYAPLCCVLRLEINCHGYETWEFLRCCSLYSKPAKACVISICLSIVAMQCIRCITRSLQKLDSSTFGVPVSLGRPLITMRFVLLHPQLDFPNPAVLNTLQYNAGVVVDVFSAHDQGFPLFVLFDLRFLGSLLLTLP